MKTRQIGDYIAPKNYKFKVSPTISKDGIVDELFIILLYRRGKFIPFWEEHDIALRVSLLNAKELYSIGDNARELVRDHESKVKRTREGLNEILRGRR